MKSTRINKLDGVDYRGSYSVTTDGRIYSEKSKRYLNPIIGSSGYHEYKLFLNGKYKRYLVHRLVAHFFIRNLTGNEFVCHKNDVKSDNRLENLYIGDGKTNMLDAYRNGGREPNNGERNGRSKLSDNDIKWIRDNQDSYTRTAMSKILGVSPTMVSYIVNGKNWKHINS